MNSEQIRNDLFNDLDLKVTCNRIWNAKLVERCGENDIDLTMEDGSEFTISVRQTKQTQKKIEPNLLEPFTIEDVLRDKA